MINLRASQMPLFMSCPNTGCNPDNLLLIEKEYPQAEVGTMLHKAIEEYVCEGKEDISNYLIRTEELGEKPHRFIKLFRNMVEMYESLRGVFPDPILEGEYNASTNLFTISGHIDMWDQPEPDKNICYAVDWKTGRKKSDHYHQMAAYAYLLHEGYGFDEVYITAVYAEDKFLYKNYFDKNDIKEWVYKVEERIQNNNYVINDKCVNCHFTYSCPAYSKFRKAAIETIMPTVNGKDNLRDLYVDERTEVVNSFKQLKSTLEDFRVVLKNEIKQNGTLELSDGMCYTLAKNGNLSHCKNKEDNNE